jgi:hypothetical protein
MEERMGKAQYGLVLLIALVGGVIGGALANRFVPLGTVRAKAFEVVRQGERLAVLDRDGLLLSARGNRALLSAAGPEVVLFHERRQTRAVLSAVAPSLMLYTQSGQRRAELVLWPDDEPHLRFYNSHDHITWEAPAPQASGEPSQRQ